MRRIASHSSLFALQNKRYLFPSPLFKIIISKQREEVIIPLPSPPLSSPSHLYPLLSFPSKLPNTPLKRGRGKGLRGFEGASYPPNPLFFILPNWGNLDGEENGVVPPILKDLNFKFYFYGVDLYLFI